MPGNAIARIDPHKRQRVLDAVRPTAERHDLAVLFHAGEPGGPNEPRCGRSALCGVAEFALLALDVIEPREPLLDLRALSLRERHRFDLFVECVDCFVHRVVVGRLRPFDDLLAKRVKRELPTRRTVQILSVNAEVTHPGKGLLDLCIVIKTREATRPGALALLGDEFLKSGLASGILDLRENRGQPLAYVALFAEILNRVRPFGFHRLEPSPCGDRHFEGTPRSRLCPIDEIALVRLAVDVGEFLDACFKALDGVLDAFLLNGREAGHFAVDFFDRRPVRRRLGIRVGALEPVLDRVEVGKPGLKVGGVLTIVLPQPPPRVLERSIDGVRPRRVRPVQGGHRGRQRRFTRLLERLGEGRVPRAIGAHLRCVNLRGRNLTIQPAERLLQSVHLLHTCESVSESLRTRVPAQCTELVLPLKVQRPGRTHLDRAFGCDVSAYDLDVHLLERRVKVFYPSADLGCILPRPTQRPGIAEIRDLLLGVGKFRLEHLARIGGSASQSHDRLFGARQSCLKEALLNRLQLSIDLPHG